MEELFLRWFAFYVMIHPCQTWAEPPRYYEEVNAHLSNYLSDIRSNYEPVMVGPKYRAELKNRQNIVKSFRQNDLPEYQQEIIETCNRLDERHAEIANKVAIVPETKSSGPAEDQKAEIESIFKARSLCATKGAYPETKRVKTYWLAYSRLDRKSQNEYDSLTSRLSQCLIDPDCRAGLKKQN